VLWADNCCGKPLFDKTIREELRRAFPKALLERLDRAHPIFDIGHVIDTVRCTAGHRKAELVERDPEVWAATLPEGGMALYTPHGLGAGWRTYDAGMFCMMHDDDALKLSDDRWLLSFQSRFGREAWLRPYTDMTLKAWGQEGLHRVDVVCPGFSADCLETLEEIGVENRGYFLEAGGGEFRYIPALNDRADHLDALARIALANLQGWVTPVGEWDEQAARARAEETRKRAEEARQGDLNT